MARLSTLFSTIQAFQPTTLASALGVTFMIQVWNSRARPVVTSCAERVIRLAPCSAACAGEMLAEGVPPPKETLRSRCALTAAKETARSAAAGQTRIPVGTVIDWSVEIASPAAVSALPAGVFVQPQLRRFGAFLPSLRL